MRPTAQTRLYALLGDPVAHTRSPLIHNAAFAALGLDAVYVALRVAPSHLREAASGFRALGLAGANVTVPHKEAIWPYLDRLTPAAEAVGAVNTLFWDGEALTGDNTDAAGFWQPLTPNADALRGAEAVVLGAGGAARAAAYALIQHSGLSQVTVAARRLEQAQTLIRHLRPQDREQTLQATTLDEAGDAVRRAALVVNATPVGMKPYEAATPWPDPSCFGPDQIAYDLVYAPAETRFLREATSRGATPLGGIGMLVGQAAASFRRWTGHPMPLDAVYRALDHD